MAGMEGYHMFKVEREVRDPAVIEELLRNGRWTTLALSSENGPYLVTLSYGYDPQRSALYFHTAKQGLKMDILRANRRVCGTIIEDRGYLHGKCSHSYRSLVIFGSISLVVSPDEVRHAFDVLLSHLERDPEGVRRSLSIDDKAMSSAQVLRLDIGTIRCKEGGSSP